MSSGKIKMRGAITGRLLPGEMRPRKMAPPSSIKRMKSKDTVAVAAAVRKPQRSANAMNSGKKRAVQDEQQPSTQDEDANTVDAASAQKAKSKTKLSKSERALKKAKEALAQAEATVQAERISIKKTTRMKDERQRQARERDAKTLKVSPPCPPARRTRAHTHAPARAHK